MARFNLENYETVADRLVKFWAEHPNGRIETRLVNGWAEGKMDQFIVHACIYRDAADAEPWATGLAEEQFAGRGPNETSPLENCETSAIGRALANAGYATTTDKRPSREEMAKVQRGVAGRPVTVEAVPGRITPEQIAEIKTQAKLVGLEGEELRGLIVDLIGRDVKAYGDLTEAEGADVLEHLAADS